MYQESWKISDKLSRHSNVLKSTREGKKKKLSGKQNNCSAEIIVIFFSSKMLLMYNNFRVWMFIIFYCNCFNFTILWFKNFQFNFVFNLSLLVENTCSSCPTHFYEKKKSPTWNKIRWRINQDERKKKKNLFLKRQWRRAIRHWQNVKLEAIQMKKYNWGIGKGANKK